MIKPSDKISELIDQFNKLEERVKFFEEKVTDLEKDKQKAKK